MEMRNTSINKDNLLSITDENVESLSPLIFSYADWGNLEMNIKIYVAENDSPTFKQQARQLQELLGNKFQLSVEFQLIKDCDHFDIVEQLCNKTFDITKSIVSVFA